MGILVLVSLLLTQATKETSVEEDLRRAKHEYAYGNYGNAVDMLRELLYPMRLHNDEQVVEARKYLALSYYLLNRLDEVGEEFAKLLYLEPDYQLDPFTVAPPVIDMLETIRKKLEPELNAIRELRAKSLAPDGENAKTKETTGTKTLLQKSDLATFMPFGMGQFQNGDTGLGVAFAITQGALLLGNIGSYVYASQVVGNAYPEEDRALVQALTVTQYASLALFGVIWSLSVFHARMHFVPLVEVQNTKSKQQTKFGLLFSF